MPRDFTDVSENRHRALISSASFLDHKDDIPTFDDLMIEQVVHILTTMPTSLSPASGHGCTPNTVPFD